MGLSKSWGIAIQPPTKQSNWVADWEAGAKPPTNDCVHYFGFQCFQQFGKSAFRQLHVVKTYDSCTVRAQFHLFSQAKKIRLTNRKCSKPLTLGAQPNTGIRQARLGCRSFIEKTWVLQI
jgi:hypothetical protein